MVDAQRALLDELMGAARNLTDEEKKGYREVRWDDKAVCTCHLVRFCPHDLFVNTKSDLGLCPRIHDQKLKESFEQSARHALYVPKFEADLAQFCEKLIQDLERKLRRGRERITQDQESLFPFPISTEKSEQLATLEEKMKKLLEQIESLGEEGKVDEAQALMKKVDLLNAEKSALLQQSMSGFPPSQEKKMALCEICGSFLVANDAVERTQSHVTGKQHLGYTLVRDYIAEYKANREKAKEEERLEAEEWRKREKGLEKAKENGRDTHRDFHAREKGHNSQRARERDNYYRGRDGYVDRERGSFGRGRDQEYEREREKTRERDISCTRSRSPQTASTVSPIRHHSRRYPRSPDHVV